MSYVFNLFDLLLSLDYRVCLCDDWFFLYLQLQLFVFWDCIFTTSSIRFVGPVFISVFIFYFLAYLQIHQRPQGWLCDWNQDGCSDITCIGFLLIDFNITLFDSLWYATIIYFIWFYYIFRRKIKISIETTTSTNYLSK